MYRIDIMTLFPDVVGDMLCESILGRAQERGYIRIECHQIRDYTLNKQRDVYKRQAPGSARCPGPPQRSGCQSPEKRSDAPQSRGPYFLS